MGKFSSLKNKQVLFIFLFSTLLLTQYTNCTTYQDDSLFANSDDPKVASTYDNKVFTPSSAQAIEIKATEDMIAFGGECNINAATGANHKIEVRLVANNAANTQFRIREDGACARNPADNQGDPSCFVVTSSCNYGKYYFNLPVDVHMPGNGAFGCDYYLRIQLVTSPNGADVRESKHLVSWPVRILGGGGCVL